MTRNPPDLPLGIDVAALEQQLRSTIRGEVRFDDGTRALYATDASNYRQVPIGVVIPRNADDVVAAVAACRAHHAPLLSRGGGTSLCGQCCNVAVVLDFSKYMNRVLAIDETARTAIVEPGCVLDDLRDQAALHGLTFAPDPATHNHNTLGGMIGNNSCGPHSVMGGETVHNVIELEILTYDGLRMWVGGKESFERMLRRSDSAAGIAKRLKSLADRHAPRIRETFPPIPRRVSGYNLPALLPENGFDIAKSLVGSEGTCVVVLQAKLRLLPRPKCRSLVVLGYDSVADAGDDVPDVMRCKPIALEGIDDRLVEDMKQTHLHIDYLDLLPEGKGWLIVEFGGDTQDEADARARKLADTVGRKDKPPSVKFVDDPVQEQHIWKVRESGLGATAHVPGKKITWEGWEDSSVPPEKLGEYLRKLRALFDQYGYGCDLYGHFGQGCVHTRIDFDLETHDGIAKFHRFLSDASDLVVRYGGSLSGEHGDGQSKAEFLPKMFGDDLVQAFREFKSIFDPQGKMNPGKVVDPFLPTQNLRIGETFNPPQPVTYFKYPKDSGVFNRAALRCVGVGNCRQHHRQTMCPSYRVTMEERHSTRGRARMLFEMLRGDTLTGGWRDENVKDSLDLCLACKGCRGDCPVHVDMATYKAEFLSHYYEGRLRPRSAYAFGLIDRWARVAARAPRIVNALTQAAWSGALAKRIAGVAPARRLPRFADETFQHRFARRTAQTRGGSPVMLWPDTFNNHFHPETAMAAVDVLEAAGFAVNVPSFPVCCGRPLYDSGMLRQAQRYLRRILARFAREISAGMPFVVLEPACAAVFRDEMPNLFPGDEVAKRLAAQTFLLAEFLTMHAPAFAPPPLPRRAIVHGHCHQKAIMKMDADEALLRKLGVDYDLLDSGCCGMAGSFGFERDKADVSVRIGELVLLPAVRAAANDCLVIADGYSCREQIAQCTGRQAMHLADVLRMALAGASADAEPVAPAARDVASHPVPH